jgi:hypothetical protein
MEERRRMLPYLEELDVELRQEVFSADGPIEHVYFPLSCVISVHTRMQAGIAVEIVALVAKAWSACQFSSAAIRRQRQRFAR